MVAAASTCSCVAAASTCSCVAAASTCSCVAHASTCSGVAARDVDGRCDLAVYGARHAVTDALLGRRLIQLMSEHKERDGHDLTAHHEQEEVPTEFVVVVDPARGVLPALFLPYDARAVYYGTKENRPRYSTFII